ncbi:MAG TPA: sigma-70 family RNA polymerase sigma factor [Pirellulales bacterium]|nr:sigma-70 family RNA polymerase sigma factor [Pirellulales bacterium]
MSNQSASTGKAQTRAETGGSERAGGFDAARLIQEHQAGVWRYLRVLGCRAAEAEDLTQETFLAVLQKPFQDYQRAATAAYLRQVARNLLISSRRRSARGAEIQKEIVERETAELNAAEAAWLRWSGHDDGQERLAALRRCLETLTARARQALELRFGQQASRAAIAAALGMSEDGAKNVLQRAKEHLRTCIEQEIAKEIPPHPGPLPVGEGKMPSETPGGSAKAGQPKGALR